MKGKQPAVRLGLRMQPELVDAMTARARRMRVSKTWALEEGVRLWLAQQQEQTACESDAFVVDGAFAWLSPNRMELLARFARVLRASSESRLSRIEARVQLMEDQVNLGR